MVFIQRSNKFMYVSLFHTYTKYPYPTAKYRGRRSCRKLQNSWYFIKESLLGVFELLFGKLDIFKELLPKERSLGFEHSTFPQARRSIDEIIKSNVGLGFSIKILDIFGISNLCFMAMDKSLIESI